MQTKTSIAAQWTRRASKTLAETIRSLPRNALYCFGAAGVLLGSHVIWSAFNQELPPILPPAGEVIEGAVPFRFAVVGDSRGNMGVFEGILGRIQADKVSFILHGGDIVQRHNERQFNWVLHELGEENLTVPFCPVPGNHDIDKTSQNINDRYRLYNKAFGARRYWFSYANALFVAFDNSMERCSAEELGWLDRTLEQLRDGYELCFVYMHVPPRDPRPGKNHALEEEDGRRLMSVLKSHDVSAVFASHIHSYVEDDIDGIPIYITGGAGAERDEPIGPHHYLLCTVEPGGSLNVEKKDVDEQMNTDYPEYAFRVKFPSNTALFGGIGFLFAGLVFISRKLARGPAGNQQSGC